MEIIVKKEIVLTKEEEKIINDFFEIVSTVYENTNNNATISYLLTDFYCAWDDTSDHHLNNSGIDDFVIKVADN